MLMDEGKQSFDSTRNDQYIETETQKYPDFQDQISNNIDEEEQKYPNIDENLKPKNQKQYAFPLPNNKPFSFQDINNYIDDDINTILNNINDPLKSYIMNLNKQKNIKNNKLIELQKQNDENKKIISNLQKDNRLLKSKLENLQKNYENEIQFLKKQKKSGIQTYRKIIENDKSLEMQKFYFNDQSYEKIKFLENENQKLLRNFYNLENENRNLVNRNQELKLIIFTKNDLIKKLNNGKSELSLKSNNNFKFEKIINEREKLLEQNNELTSGIQDFNKIVKETSEIFRNKTVYFNTIINSYKNKLNEYKNKIILLKKKINELNSQLNLKNELKSSYNFNYNTKNNKTFLADMNDIFENHNRSFFLKENLLFSPIKDKVYNTQKQSAERYKKFLYSFDN